MNNFNSKKNWKNQIDKLLFVFASLYLMTTVGWVWKYKQQSQRLNEQKTNSIIENKSEENQISNSKQNNLKVNENKLNDSNIPEKLVLSIPLPEVDTPTNQINTLQINTQQTEKKNNSNVDTTNQLSLLPPIPPPPINTVEQNPQPISSPPKPQKNVSSPKKLTTVPTINSLKTEIKPSENTLPQQVGRNSVAPVNNVNNTNYTYNLVGVVQLPDNNSFALFKINNLTEKIPVGSEIGTSGWVLMAVNGKQAVVSRNNQSFNITVGETFN